MYRLSEDIENLLGLGLRFKYWMLAQVGGISLAGLWAWLNAGVDTYIWHPSVTYYLMLTILVADFGTGSWLAWRQGRFETRKALRSVWKLVTYTFLLALAHNLGKTERMFSWLPEAVLFPMIILLLLSMLKNMSLLGWIEPHLAAILYRKIDTYKNPDTDASSHTPES
ncbi:MAG: phage holin family protein [Bacteroidetes bacterium]|nr:phage holin family protein [Bacteroidota bacterium]